MLISTSVSAQDVVKKKKDKVVTLQMPGVPGRNEVYIVASTVCLEGKLFAVAVQKDNSGKSSGITMTQVMESNKEKVQPVECKSKEQIMKDAAKVVLDVVEKRTISILY